MIKALDPLGGRMRQVPRCARTSKETSMMARKLTLARTAVPIAARILAVALGAAAALFVLPTPAAGVTFVAVNDNHFDEADDVEGFDRVGTGSGTVRTPEPDSAHNGWGYVALSTTRGNWSAVRTELYLGPPGGSCSLSVYVNPLGGSVTVNVEVINPDTWTYVALKTATVTGAGYQQVKLSFRSSGPEDSVFRVALTNPPRTPPATAPYLALAYVDTLKSRCEHA